MPMKSLPVLTITDGSKETIYCQSGAIAKYLAKKFGKYVNILNESRIAFTKEENTTGLFENDNFMVMIGSTVAQPKGCLQGSNLRFLTTC